MNLDVVLTLFIIALGIYYIYLKIKVTMIHRNRMNLLKKNYTELQTWYDPFRKASLREDSEQKEDI